MTIERKNNNVEPLLVEIKVGAEKFKKGEFDYDTLTFLNKVSRTWEMDKSFYEAFAQESPEHAKYYNKVVIPETKGILTEITNMDRVQRAVCLYMAYAAERNIDRALLNADTARLFCDTAELFDELRESSEKGDGLLNTAVQYDNDFYMDCASFSLHYASTLNLAQAGVEVFEKIVPRQGETVWKWASKVA